VRERIIDSVAGLLQRAGIIDRERLDRTVRLAWPRIVTGFAIMSKQTVDLALVGWAVGATAVAGLAFAYAYWTLAKFAGIGLAGGTVALVSQNYGGDEIDRASLVVKQGVWAALLVSIPVVVCYAVFAGPLVDVLGSDPAALDHGATYLTIVAPALLFEFLNLLASRTYAGVGDTFTPMVARAGGGLLNIVLSGVLVAFGLGVTGVALGTLVSTAAVLVVLSWGVFGRGYPVRGMSASPVPLKVGGPQFDGELAGQLVSVSAPLVARRLAEMLVVFPLLWIAATFGPVVVAAFEVGRRVRDLLVSFTWGFAIASSTVVGQELGGGDEREADAYGRAIVRLSVLVYLVAAAVVFLFAPWIARLFVSGSTALAQTTPFVRVAAVTAIFLGVNGSVVGALRGAGDTTWPFIAALVGQYVVALPVAVVGLVTPVGVWGLYLAVVLGALVPIAFNLWRYRTGRWKAISREYRPSSTD
jgi:putative MATE family efflux protein